MQNGKILRKGLSLFFILFAISCMSACGDSPEAIVKDFEKLQEKCDIEEKDIALSAGCKEDLNNWQMRFEKLAPCDKRKVRMLLSK